MAFRNFYRALESDFPCNSNTFNDWWSVNKYAGIRPTRAISTSETILIGSEIARLYKIEVSGEKTPDFYIFNALSSVGSFNLWITKNQSLSYYTLKDTFSGSEPIPVEPKWSYKIGDFYWAIQRQVGGTIYYYIVAQEKTTALSKVVFSNYVAPTPNSFEVWQPITFTTSASATATKTTATIDSTGITTGTTTTQTVTYASEQAQAEVIGSANIVASYQGVTDTKTITITDYTNKTYSIVAVPNASYAIYAGKQIGNDFLNAYRVAFVKSNTYHSETTYPQSSLQLSLVSNNTPSENLNTYSFSYDISSFSETEATSINFSTNTFHKLANGDTKFNNLNLKTGYSLGDVITTPSASSLGYLTFDDGTAIRVEELDISSISLTCSLGALPVTITAETPNTFTLTLTLTSTTLGTVTKTYNCQKVASAQVARVELVGYKTLFNSNEVFEYGSSAVLNLYNSSGVLIDTITSANIRSYLSYQDPKYGSIASNPNDQIVILKSTAFGFDFYQNVCVTYYEEGLILDVSEVTLSYIINSQTFTDFDYTGLVAKVKKHTNLISNGNIVTVVTEEDVSNNVSKTHSTVDFTTAKTYQIRVAYTDTYSKSHVATYDVVAEPLVIEGVAGSGSQTYYDNDASVFTTPTIPSVKITVYYNDSDYDYELQNFNNVTFYRDEQCTKQLTSGTTVLKSEDGNLIYFKVAGINHVGHYNISFVTDQITAVNVKSSLATISVVLGNRLRDYESSFIFTCTRQSGVDVEITQGAFYFDNNDILLSAPASVSVTITGYGSFAIGNLATKVAFANPYAKMVVDPQNFQTEYNNKTDAINPSTLMATVKYYKDSAKTIPCEYEQTLAYSSTATSDYTKFTVSGQDDLTSYVFGTVLNLIMGSDTEKTEHVLVSGFNRFDNTDTSVHETVTLKVIEITSITGIKLVSAKTNYTIGETFLDENDDTTITIFYKDTQDNARSYTCLLRSGLSAINIFPIKGTQLNLISNEKIVEITAVNNVNIKVQYAITVSNATASDTTKEHHLVVLRSNWHTLGGDKYWLIDRYATINGEQVESTKIGNTGSRVLNDNVTFDDIVVYGYLDDVLDETVNAKVVLFDDFVSPIEGSNNITVKFPCYVEGNADLINKCRFGMMFGSDNSRNRLFVSGNEDYKNKDWHSSAVDSNFVDDELSIDGNFGYFEDLSECVYGETDNAIVGYSIVSNDKLLVLKSKSNKETTVYFRQPQLVTAVNGAGSVVTGLDDETLYQEEYSVVKGNNSVAGINANAITNFNGDTLFMTADKQIVGLDLTGIIGDNQRYANSRSAYIDEDMKNYDVSKSFIWTNNYYLIVVLPTKLYLTHYELKGESQYEWFVMDVADVQSIVEIDGTIYFGNSKGQLYKFTNTYTDARKVFAGYGVSRMTVDEQNELLFAVGDLADIDTTKEYYFKPVTIDSEDPYIYYSLGTVQNSKNADCDFYVDNGDTRNVIKINRTGDELTRLVKRIGEYEEVFLNHIDSNESQIITQQGSTLASAWGKPFYLKSYLGANASECLYQLIDENGNVAPVKELYRARICKRVTKPLKMAEINKLNGTFKLLEEDRTINIVQYKAQTLVNAFKGEIINYENVEAFYITKPYVMGNLEYFKTIWSFTLTNDSNIPSELEVCYASNKIPYDELKTLAKVSKDVLGFDISTFDFSRVDFDKNVVPRTYTNKRVLSNVKFLCFAFRNLNDSNSVLSSMAITYTLPYPSYGGN